MGIWALGYDKGHDDFWNVIHDELSAIPKNMPNPGGEYTEAGSTEGKANPNANVNTIGKMGKEEKESGPIMTAISTMLGLPDPESKINKLEEKLPAVTDYKYVLLIPCHFSYYLAWLVFFIALLFTDTRAVFFSTRTLKTYYMIAVLS